MPETLEELIAMLTKNIAQIRADIAGGLPTHEREHLEEWLAETVPERDFLLGDASAPISASTARAIAVGWTPSTSRMRAVALRAHAANIAVHFWSATDAAEFLGLPSCTETRRALPTSTSRKLAALVTAGKLKRTRTYCWRYEGRRIQTYLLSLAADLDKHPTDPGPIVLLADVDHPLAPDDLDRKSVV